VCVNRRKVGSALNTFRHASITSRCYASLFPIPDLCTCLETRGHYVGSKGAPAAREGGASGKMSWL
jgi:hypothetical protein